MKYLFRAILIFAVITSIGLINAHITMAATEVAPEATYLIRRYETSLRLADNDVFVLEGQTYTYTVVDQVSVTVYLQIWYESKWHDIDSWTSTRNNDTMAYVSVPVGGMPKGYFYRVRGEHRATQNHYPETLYTYTSSVYF